ncbi:tyrosine-type recombinase/integrase [Kordia sp.]|uniref:tyrosine-type recombinase/integrase n=1 Tax=Kordia sp. TaxID=1965332 RepID=UPI003D6B22F6
MNTHKINILYILSSSRIRKDKKAPIYCRITYNKQRKTFSTGQFVNPKHWNSKQQVVKPPDPSSKLINTQLSLIKTKFNQAFLMLQVKKESFDVNDIYRLYRGEKDNKEYNTVEYFDRYLNKLEKLVGIDIEKKTWKKFEHVKRDVKFFIKWKYKSIDYPLKDLKQQFLTDFEYYLKTERKLGQATINKVIQRFRKPIRIAVAENYLDKDPFMLFKAKRVKKEIVFLTKDELDLLEKYKFSQTRLQFVKNLFVFCCYTGLPYIELMNLKHNHIINGFDGNKWIKTKRVKTSKDLSIPLLPKALEIINYYDEDDYVFPRISNQKYNSFLKEIASILGIEKNLTTHIARKTFATTVLLYNDVPMEIVSELLGHSSMNITQAHYGKIVQKKVSEEMNKLNNKLKK